MNITVELEREHSFQNQIRKPFVLSKGISLTGDLRIFASTWPFGILHHEKAGSLGVEFTFLHDGKRWLYRGVIDCRRLWPAPGSRVESVAESDHFEVGPILGMRDSREDYFYILSDGSERRFPLKYVGFECWFSCCEDRLKVKLRHFLPGDDYVAVSYLMPIEDVLFQKERQLYYDAEGFLEDSDGWRPFVQVEECAP